MYTVLKIYIISLSFPFCNSIRFKFLHTLYQNTFILIIFFIYLRIKNILFCYIIINTN